MKSSSVLALILILLIVSVYTRYYSKYNDGYEMVQTNLDKVTIDLVYEKNPVLIYEPITKPKQLLSTLFKYSYLFKFEYSIHQPEIIVNTSKFSLIYPKETNTDLDGNIFVNIINPSNKSKLKFKRLKNGLKIASTPFQDANIDCITIKMKPNQVLVLPSHWMFQSTNELHKIDLDDLFSYIYFKFV
jgi:hypothetical protein